MENSFGNEEGKNDGAETLVFHYNREERLKNAPQIVKDYYDGKIKAYQPGIFKALVSTKANRFIFFALLICVGVVIFNMFFGPKNDRASISGIPLSLSAFSVEDTIYTSVRADKPEKKFRDFYGKGKSATITVDFSGLDSENTPLIFGNDAERYEGNEIFLRTTLTDFDILFVSASVSLVVDGKELTANLRTKVERR